jgi:hypothetical protein
MPRYPEKLSVASLDPQIKVFTRQHNLQKILVVQKSISIGIIEVDQSLAVILCKRKDSTIPQKLENVTSIDILLRCSVNSHEGTIRGKVGEATTELLTENF